MKNGFTWDVNWGDDYLDSRDIQNRYEELKDELELLEEVVSDAEQSLNSWKEDNWNEYTNLKSVVEQAEGCSDWNYGEQLIKDSAFVDYTENLIDDCCELPKEFSSGNWPWRHMTIDYSAAAEELKSDYTTIECDGETYYIRS